MYPKKFVVVVRWRCIIFHPDALSNPFKPLPIHDYTGKVSFFMRKKSLEVYNPRFNEMMKFHLCSFKLMRYFSLLVLVIIIMFIKSVVRNIIQLHFPLSFYSIAVGTILLHNPNHPFHFYFISGCHINSKSIIHIYNIINFDFCACFFLSIIVG